MPFPIDFDLPPHLIAQQPCPRRDQSRLLVVRRREHSLAHHRFHELPALLSPKDLLVINDTSVIPARLVGRRRTGGKWEGLFVRTLADGTWEILCKGRLRPGDTVIVEPCAAAEAPGQPTELRLIANLGGGHWQVIPADEMGYGQFLKTYGHMPLPYYIRQGQDQPEDHERYQTIFARHPGAIAAPTAGLHFTAELLEHLTKSGIATAQVTLHVGLGTFAPIRHTDFAQHVMHHEWGQLPEATVAAIRECRARQGRVVAIGTTTVRVLETVAADGEVRTWAGQTNLFIYPPYRFLLTDALLTNFHLPRSTLLLLVSAFAGAQLLEEAYRTAIAEGYRFFSYGDAMLIL